VRHLHFLASVAQEGTQDPSVPQHPLPHQFPSSHLLSATLDGCHPHAPTGRVPGSLGIPNTESPWYSSIPRKTVTNPEPIDSPCSTWKSKQQLKHLDEVLAGQCTGRGWTHCANLAWTGPCSSPRYLQMRQCSSKAHRPIHDTIFQLGGLFLRLYAYLLFV